MIRINHVTKSFPGLSKPVLAEIDFSLEPGDFCVLIGANGCGKSTLLKLISGDYQADSGSVQVGGRVAQVVQDVTKGTIPEMTLLENMALGDSARPRFAFYNRYKAAAIERVRALHEGLESYINQPLSALSGGQRQMIATCMAMHAGCEILLLDEHISALDPKMQSVLMHYTAQQVAQLGLTTLMITHKIDDAITYGNRLIMIDQGRIVLDVQGAEKQAVQVSELLALFHHYEDRLLLSEIRHDH